jgi:hypothetical protein
MNLLQTFHWRPNRHEGPAGWPDHCLAASVREHLYACAVLPDEIRRRAEDARRTARRLIKDNRQLADGADVLMREAEAAIAAFRETMTRFP